MNKATLITLLFSIILVSSVESFAPNITYAESNDGFGLLPSRNPGAEANVVGEKIFDPGDAYPRQLIFAHGYLWATTFTSPARLFKIDPDTLEHQRIIFDSSYPNATDMVATEDAIWIILGTDPTKIIKVDPSTLAWSEVVSFPSNELVFGGSLEYAFGYIWAGGYHNALARINPSNFMTEVFQYSLIDNGTHFVNIVQGDDGYLWAATASAAGQGGLSEVLKIDSADPTSYQSVQLTQKVSDDIAYAEGALFAVGEQNPSKIFKINSDLTYTTTQTIGPSYGVSWSSIDQQLYATYATSPGVIKSFNTDLDELKSITLPVGYNSPNEIVTDGQRYLFATTWQNPFRLVKIDLLVRSWTLMYYLAEDNDLSNEYLGQEAQLISLSQNANINLIVLIDTKDSTPQIIRFQDGQKTILYEYPNEESTGNPVLLSDLLTYSFDGYPANHFALILHGHANGLIGIGTDENPDNDTIECKPGLKCLTFQEIREVLESYPKLDLIDLDGCSAATFEAAFELNERSSFLVASAYRKWTPSYNYDEINIQPSTDPRSLGVLMANAYVSQHMGKPRSPAGTISVLDLSFAGAVKTHVDGLAILLNENLENNQDLITGITNDVSRYAYDAQDLDADLNDPLIDLGHFASLVFTRFNDPNVQSEASNLLTDLESFVYFRDQWWSEEEELFPPYCDPGFCDLDFSNHRGVSIFLPSEGTTYYSGVNYIFLEGTTWPVNSRMAEVNSGWGDFVISYVEHTNPDYEIIPFPESPVITTGVFYKEYLPMVSNK